jgi:hypothetical protein
VSRGWIVAVGAAIALTGCGSSGPGGALPRLEAIPEGARLIHPITGSGNRSLGMHVIGGHVGVFITCVGHGTVTAELGISGNAVAVDCAHDRGSDAAAEGQYALVRRPLQVIVTDTRADRWRLGVIRLG